MAAGAFLLGGGPLGSQVPSVTKDGMKVIGKDGIVQV